MAVKVKRNHPKTADLRKRFDVLSNGKVACRECHGILCDRSPILRVHLNGKHHQRRVQHAAAAAEAGHSCASVVDNNAPNITCNVSKPEDICEDRGVQVDDEETVRYAAANHQLTAPPAVDNGNMSANEVLARWRSDQMLTVRNELVRFVSTVGDMSAKLLKLC